MRMLLIQCLTFWIIGVITGCGPAHTELDAAAANAMADYRAGRYEDSLRHARIAASTESGVERDRANLLAGMSAFQLQRYAQARETLEPLTTSRDDEVGGRASVLLGMMDIREDRRLDAVTRFKAGARRLRGDDRARACLLAGESLASLRQADEAGDAWREGLESATDPSLKAALRTRLNATPGQTRFALQVGAFSQRANADRCVDRLRRLAATGSIGLPRIDEERDALGRRLHYVRIGRFATRSDAEAARRRLGEGVVRRLDESG